MDSAARVAPGPSAPDRVDAVFEGGGVRGIGLVGALEVVEQFGYSLQNVAGTVELGGNPIDVRNLWPQPYKPLPGAKEKDWLENHLKAEVCAGRMTLADPQDMIRTDWAASYKELHP